MRDGGRLGLDPAFVEGAIDDGLLDVLDGDRRLVDAEHAGRLARRGTDAAGELREIVGGVQRADGFAPAAAIDQIVPVGNDVVQRAAGVAEGNAAIHAARALRADFLLGKRLVDLEPVVDALGDGTARRAASRVYSRKPVTLPMGDLRIGCAAGRGSAHGVSARACIRAGRP